MDSPSEMGVKIFGVRIMAGRGFEDEEDVMRKSASTGNLALCDAAGGAAGEKGYASESGGGSRRRRGGGAMERKRGVPWTEEEHRTFLAGLKKLGKGDWRGISREYVRTRTPTQVASHAQKYFLRQTNLGRKKRRSSLFDVVPDESVMATDVENDLALPRKKTNEDHTHQDNNSAGTPSLDAIQAVDHGPEASQALTVTAHCSSSLYSDHVNLMTGVSSSKKDQQAIPTLAPALGVTSYLTPAFHNNYIACVPDFLNMSLQHQLHHQLQHPLHYPSSAASALTESNDLELSIAPPQPRSLSKSSYLGETGAIRVI